MQPTRPRRKRGGRVEATHVVFVFVSVVVVGFEMGFVRVDVADFGVVFGGGVFLARIRNRLVETFRLQNPLGEETPRAPLRVVQRRQRRSERERFVMRALRRQPRFVFFLFAFVENGPMVARELFVAERFVAELFVVVVAREAAARVSARRDPRSSCRNGGEGRACAAAAMRICDTTVSRTYSSAVTNGALFGTTARRSRRSFRSPPVGSRERFAEHLGRGRHPQRDRRRGRVRLRRLEAGARAAPRDDGRRRLVLRAVRAARGARARCPAGATPPFLFLSLLLARAAPRARPLDRSAPPRRRRGAQTRTRVP